MISAATLRQELRELEQARTQASEDFYRYLDERGGRDRIPSLRDDSNRRGPRRRGCQWPSHPPDLQQIIDRQTHLNKRVARCLVEIDRAVAREAEA